MAYSYCPNCFNETDGKYCPYCGYNQENMREYSLAVSPANILGAKYLVGRVLGQGGFGITYLAKDMSTNQIVAIKECLPEAFTYRDSSYRLYPKSGDTFSFNQCKENFRNEISVLYSLRENPFVVRLIDGFFDNNTEYFSMEYIDGVNLKTLMHNNGGKTSFENAILIFLTIGSTLMEIHKKGIIHRDISPENIMISNNGAIKLIDFGASKNYLNEYSSDNESIFLKPGFAPPEQYSTKGDQGPWTDVYALGATFYTIVSGQPLVDSIYRLDEDSMKSLRELGCNVPDYVSDAVEKSLSPVIENRYQSVEEFLNDMAPASAFATDIDDVTLSAIRNQKQREIMCGSNVRYRDVDFPYVQIVSGNSVGKEIQIPDYAFVCLGRDEETADIAVHDYEEISRMHCLVGYDRSKNRFIVIDKSSNGTYYFNGQRMMYNAESYINPEDEFYLYASNVRVKVMLRKGGA